MKVAVVGATGLVGQKMIQILEERAFPVTEFIAAASERSVGKLVSYNGREYSVISVEDAIAAKPDIALFSAGGSTSLQYAPDFEAVGTTVIDNSSAWRMDPTKKLVVPEVNAHVLTREDKIIANPNCSTIQMVVALKPLHDLYQIDRIVVSTYQSVSGTGAKGVQQLKDERAGIHDGAKAYPYPIDLNILPHIDVFLDNHYTKEEMKMILETQKIMGDDSIRVTATAVRVPVWGGHSESVNISFHKPIDMQAIRQALQDAPSIQYHDDPSQLHYPMPLDSYDNDYVWVGRLRRDESIANGINLWIVSDNVRKGAATNAVQIAEIVAKL